MGACGSRGAFGTTTMETETNVDDYDADGERRRTVLIDDTLSLWCSQSHHHLSSCFMDACGSRGASGDDETSETKTKTKFWTIIVYVSKALILVPV